MRNRSKYACILFILCGMAAASIGVCQNTPGVFYAAVADDLAMYRGTFAIHATLSLLGTALMSLYVTKIMKKITMRLQVVLGASVMVVTTLFMSIANSIPTFYTLGFLRGVGAGLCATVPITLIVNQWFYEKTVPPPVWLSVSAVWPVHYVLLF